MLSLELGIKGEKLALFYALLFGTAVFLFVFILVLFGSEAISVIDNAADRGDQAGAVSQPRNQPTARVSTRLWMMEFLFNL